jgi:hypothetical protein
MFFSYLIHVERRSGTIKHNKRGLPRWHHKKTIRTTLVFGSFIIIWQLFFFIFHFLLLLCFCFCFYLIFFWGGGFLLSVWNCRIITIQYTYINLFALATKQIRKDRQGLAVSETCTNNFISPDKIYVYCIYIRNWLAVVLYKLRFPMRKRYFVNKISTRYKKKLK